MLGEPENQSPLTRAALSGRERAGRFHPLLEQYVSDNKGRLKDKVRSLWALRNDMGQLPGPWQRTDFKSWRR